MWHCCQFVFDCVLNQYKSQKVCDRVVSEDPFLIVYCPDKYKSLTMCDEAVHDSLAALKLIPEYFVTSKMIKKLYTALYEDENIIYFNEDFGNIVFFCDKMGILNIDLNNINLDNNFDEYDPDAIVFIRIFALHIKFEKHKALKKPKWRINVNSVASYKMAQFRMSKDEQKKIEPIFTKKCF